MAYPRFVEIHEEGPREGFQMESRLFPTAEKISLVDALSATGLKKIQVASFVNPQKVPAMADAADIFAGIKKYPNVRHTALWLNKRGILTAINTPGVDVDGKLIIYTTERFCQANNNCSLEEHLETQRQWLETYVANNIPLEAIYVCTAFGCQMDGPVDIPQLLSSIRATLDLCAEMGLGVPAVVLGDTVGWANPDEIKRRVAAVRELTNGARVGLHLHDTRGMGSANFFSALQEGVDLFDGSVGGLGGCPFCGHKDATTAGNVCTEDMVQMCHELGIETGINLELLIEASLMAERIIGRTLTGRTMHSGSIESRRQLALKSKTQTA